MVLFKNKIKELREQNHMSQAYLAEKLFTSQGTVSLWETGERAPDADAIITMADIFNVSTDELLGRNCVRRSRTGTRFDETANYFFDMIQGCIEKAYEERLPEHVLKDE